MDGVRDVRTISVADDGRPKYIRPILTDQEEQEIASWSVVDLSPVKQQKTIEINIEKEEAREDDDELEPDAEPVLLSNIKGTLVDENVDTELADNSIDWSTCNADDFEYFDLLGEGSFGQVVRVRHKGSGQFFALKVLSEKQLLEGHALEEERNILRILRHPFIVKFYHSFVPTNHPDHMCLVLELVQGENFDSVMKERHFNESKKKRDPLPEDVARFYFAELVLAIEYIHSKRIAYRDFKPDNFILRSDGHICLIDFGVSSFLHSHKRCKTRIGADGFKAPEMLMGAKSGYTESVDWWNVGIVFYMILAGKHPFRNKWDFFHSTDHYVKKALKEQEEAEKGRKERVEHEDDGEGESQGGSGPGEGHSHLAPRGGAAGAGAGAGGQPLALKAVKGVSSEANSLLLMLLDPDAEARGRNCRRIKEHPFFATVDWHKMATRQVKAPVLLVKEPKWESKPRYSSLDDFLDTIPDPNIVFP